MSQGMPPGWYPDPAHPRKKRWWTGQGWGPEVETESDHKSLKRVLIGAIASGLVATTFLVIQNSAVGERICSSGPAERAPRLAQLLCTDDRLRVTDEQARDYLDALFASANGSQRDADVWEMMLHEDASRRDVRRTWGPVLRIERLDQPVRVQGTNTFRAHVRVFLLPEDVLEESGFYRATLNVYQRDITVTVRHTGSGLRAANLDFSGNDPEGRVTPRAATALIRSDFYDTPLRVEDELAAVDPGSTIYEVCQLEQPDSPDETWWAWTYLGWVPHSDLDVTDRQLPGVRMCVYRERP